MRNLGTTLTSNVRNTGAGTVAATLLILLVVVGPAPASAGTLLDRALEIAAARAFSAGQGAAATSTECLLATNAGTTEGGSEASFRYFGNGLIMPFYAVGKARQSPAEPPAEVLQRYPGQLGECFADGYRDARRARTRPNRLLRQLDHGQHRRGVAHYSGPHGGRRLQ